MKQRLSILLIISSLLLAACGSTDNSAAGGKEDKQAVVSADLPAEGMDNSNKLGEGVQPYQDFTPQTKPLTTAYQSLFQNGEGGKILIDSIAADLNGDGKAELVVLQGLASGSGTETYEAYELVVFDPETESIVYSNQDLDFISGYPEKLLAGDFTNDKLAEVKVKVLSEGTAGATFNILLSYQNGEYVDLFDEKPFSEGVTTTITEDGRIVIASEILGKYYYIPFNEEQMAADDLYYGMRHDHRNAVPTGDHTYVLQESYQLNGPLYNADFIAEVTVDYRYEDRKFVLETFSVKSMNGMPVTEGERPVVFVLDNTLGEAIASGHIPGLGVQLGMTKAEASALLGKEMREYNYLGGKFFEFEKAPGAGLCFSAAMDTSTDSLYALAIHQHSVTGKTLEEVKAILGPPSSSGYDEMEDSQYIRYSYGETGVVFHSTDNDSPVSFMLILYK